MSIESMIPSNHLILCCSLLLPSIFPSIRVFSNELALHIRWPKYWSFSFSKSPSNEYSGLISFRIDWFAVQRTLQESSPAPQFKSINSLALSLLYGPTLTSILLLFSHSVVSNSCNPMNCSTPGFPVLQHLPEFAQTHVH